MSRMIAALVDQEKETTRRYSTKTLVAVVVIVIVPQQKTIKGILKNKFNLFSKVDFQKKTILLKKGTTLIILVVQEVIAQEVAVQDVVPVFLLIEAAVHDWYAHQFGQEIDHHQHH